MDTDARATLDALEDGSDHGDRVHLVVPPSSEYLRTVRLVAADAAVRTGADLDEVEDFRIAIDELCHLLMTATDHFVHLSLTSHGNEVVGHGSARARSDSAPVALDEVSAMIVEATADHHSIERRGPEITFEVSKHVQRPLGHDVPGRMASRP
jgi:hypothetical protein